MNYFKSVILVSTLFLIAACDRPAEPVVAPVEQFDAQRYMGTWYEILRLPHSFQEGLHNVTAEYRLNEDGTFEITNRGYHVQDGRWVSAIGKASPIEGMPASFRVQLQWPFRSGYYIAELDPDYQYAVVVSDDTDTFWLLARTADVPRWVIDQALAQALSWGYDVNSIIETRHIR